MSTGGTSEPAGESRGADAWEIWAWLALVVWILVRWPLATTDAWLPQLPGGASGGGPLPHALLPLAVTLGALAPGAWLVGRLALPDASPTETLVLAAVLGLGAISTALAGLALAGALTRTAISVTVAALCLGPLLARSVRGSAAWSALAALPRRLRELAGAASPASRVAGVALALTAAVSAVKALIPPWYPDSLYYHLALPRLYLAAGGFVPVAHDPLGGTQPGFSQMLFAIPLSWRMEDAAALFAWMYLPLTLLATGLIARRVAGAPAAAGAVALLLATPHVPWVAATPVADLPFTAHVTVALLASVRAAGDDTGRWSFAAALCLGLALASKFQALAPAGLLWLALSLARRSVAHAVRLAVLMALPFAPWAVRGIREWGSPLFPVHMPAGTDPAVRELLALFRADWATHGHRAGLPWLPFDLTFLSRIDDLAAYEGEIGPLWLALAPLALLVRWDPARGALALFALVQLGVWTVGGREVRYLFPALPPLAICLAACAADPRFRARAERLTAAVAVAALAWFIGQARPAQDLPYLSGRESAPNYYRTLSATSDLYRACEALAGAPRGSRALFFWDDRGYFCPVPYRPDHLVPVSSNAVLHRLPAEPDALLARLRALGVTHLVINRGAWKEAVDSGLEWPFGSALERLLTRPELSRAGPVPPGSVEVWAIGAGR